MQSSDTVESMFKGVILPLARFGLGSVKDILDMKYKDINIIVQILSDSDYVEELAKLR